MTMNNCGEQGSESVAVTGYLDSVATDIDLVTFLELKYLGFTTANRVSPTRENLLEEYDIKQLRSEIGRDYSIDPESVLQVEQLCLAGIYRNAESFLHGQA